MNGLLGVGIGVVGFAAAIRFLPAAIDRLLGPPDPEPRDSEGNPISG